jgi:putative component of toxin-antitoxin plasmid stabilization module
VIEVVQTELFRRWLERLRDRRAQVRIAARIIAIQEGHLGDKQSQRRDIETARRLVSDISDPKEPEQ